MLHFNGPPTSVNLGMSHNLNSFKKEPVGFLTEGKLGNIYKISDHNIPLHRENCDKCTNNAKIAFF